MTLRSRDVTGQVSHPYRDDETETGERLSGRSRVTCNGACLARVMTKSPKEAHMRPRSRDHDRARESSLSDDGPETGGRRRGVTRTKPPHPLFLN